MLHFRAIPRGILHRGQPDKTLLEVVNHDGEQDLTGPADEARREKKREIEAKLILSSYVKGWTIAENLIAEKNVRHEPYEFGYAAGVSRPLALTARNEPCNLCPENFQAGVEVYGGLGTHDNFGLRGTSHYVAPTLAWALPNGTTFRVSPGFGVTEGSSRYLLRFGVSYEIARLGHRKEAAVPLQPIAGAKLYARECASCHGANREGMGKAPPLNGSAINHADPRALLSIIRNGSIHHGMPSFAHLPEQQRWQIVTFLRASVTVPRDATGGRR